MLNMNLSMGEKINDFMFLAKYQYSNEILQQFFASYFPSSKEYGRHFKYVQVSGVFREKEMRFSVSCQKQKKKLLT